MQFRVSSEVVTAVVTDDPLFDEHGEPADGLADWGNLRVLLKRGMPPHRRRRTLIHELCHCWRYTQEQPANIEAECDFVARVADTAWEDVERQGGMGAFSGLFGEAAVAVGGPGPSPEVPAAMMTRAEAVRAVKYPDVDEARWTLIVGECYRYGIDVNDAWIVWSVDERTGEEIPALRTTLHDLRVICRRTGLVESESDYELCGADGVWVKVWTRPDNPSHARATVRRKDYAQDFAAVVEYRHCVRWKADGTGPTEAWVDGPAPMLGKCAVVAAYRKAFHEVIGQLVTREEADPTGIRPPPLSPPPGPRLAARRSRPVVAGSIGLASAAVGPGFPPGFAARLAAAVGVGPAGELVDDPRLAARWVTDETPDDERGLLLALMRGDRGKADAEAVVARHRERLPRTVAADYRAFAAVVVREAGRG